MEERYYTIGMAGHIDHGKTTLTKVLTNIDTDRLKEEKERNISIELGYAPLQTHNGTQISIVDVPGHERFIRQMIAGVAGIDLVVLVIAADEGVMPQTQEHLEILDFLGIEHCIVAITKIDRVDEELLELVQVDITETLQSTSFGDAPMVFVDSLSNKGIEQLRTTIFKQLKCVKNRDSYGAFRMPIDQVFTIQGQGTIVRGTVYEGLVRLGSELTILPKEKRAKARNIQVHNHNVEEAKAGQRAAINVSGIDRNEVERGDVLVLLDHFIVTHTIDVSIRFVAQLRMPLKQRTPVKIHIGTSEVMGTIVYFDRNVVDSGNQEVLCQIRLQKEIVVRRGDRFIVRRPTPMETVGGGWVIDPNGERYKFGDDTIQFLQKKKNDTPEELVIKALKNEMVCSNQDLIQSTSLEETQVGTIVEQLVGKGLLLQLPNRTYTHVNTLEKIVDQVKSELEEYHRTYPMRIGIDKAELTQVLKGSYPKQLINFTIENLKELNQVSQKEQYILLGSFEPHIPQKWQTRMNQIINSIQNDGIIVQKWEDYVKKAPFSHQEKDDFKRYLVHTNQLYQLTEDLFVHKQSLDRAVTELRTMTGISFTLQEAKDVWGVSRKYLIPVLEHLDQLNITIRQDKLRYWV